MIFRAGAAPEPAAAPRAAVGAAHPGVERHPEERDPGEPGQPVVPGALFRLARSAAEM